MEVQLGTSREPQIQFLALDDNLPLPWEIILRGQHNLLIKFDLRGHLHLILIAGRDLEMLLLAGQHNFILDIFLLILIDD